MGKYDGPLMGKSPELWNDDPSAVEYTDKAEKFLTDPDTAELAAELSDEEIAKRVGCKKETVALVRKSIREATPVKDAFINIGCAVVALVLIIACLYLFLPRN